MNVGVQEDDIMAKIFWKSSNEVVVRTETPAPKPRLAILCRNWDSLLETASLLENYFTAFQGRKQKMASYIIEIVGEFLEEKM